MHTSIFYEQGKNGTGIKENVFADFLINKGLYDEIEITCDNTSELADLVGGHVRISVYCPKCKEKRVFVSDIVEYSDCYNGIPITCNLEDAIRSNKISFTNPVDTLLSSVPKEAYRIITIKYVCTMDREHHLDYTLLINGNKMKKIGQYPSIADLSNQDIKEYQKVMSNEDKDEFKRAIGLFANGIGIGSFVYLRRIYERIIEEEGKEAISKGEIDSNEFKNANEPTRVKMLSKHLPEILKDNTAFYGIVSKGIHELSEKDCLNYFPIMRIFIEIVFREREKLRKEKKENEELCKAINKINSEIKNSEKD